MRENRSNPGRDIKAASGHTMRKIGIALLVVWIGLASGSLVLLGDDADAMLAPLFTLRNLNDEEVSLESYRGSVVILDFWATWCMPCTKIFPEIHALQELYADRGVALLVISFDKHAEDARDYLIENELPTDNVLWGSLKEAHAVKDLFDVCGIVHTIVIDREGYIRYSGHPTKLNAEAIEPWL